MVIEYLYFWVELTKRKICIDEIKIKEKYIIQREGKKIIKIPKNELFHRYYISMKNYELVILSILVFLILKLIVK